MTVILLWSKTQYKMYNKNATMEWIEGTFKASYHDNQNNYFQSIQILQITTLLVVLYLIYRSVN